MRPADVRPVDVSMDWITVGLDWIGSDWVGGELHTPPPPSLLSVLRTGVWVRVRGVHSLAKHPERVGTGPKDKKRLQIQLTWQNRPKKNHPVPPLPGAREGRGSLELVAIFQMRPSPPRFTPVCRSRCGTRGRSAAPAPGGSYVVWDHSPCVWFFVCRPIERTLPTGLWDQQRRARSECECEYALVCECECECGCACYCECARECECECVSGIFQMWCVARRFTPVCRRRRGAGGVLAPGGSYVV